MAREDEIRLIAYRIWEESGCPNGRDCEHWFEAEAVWEKQQAGRSAQQTVKPTSSLPASSAAPGQKTAKKNRGSRRR